MTHTIVELGLSLEAYEEIKAKLTKAGYQHAFMEDGTIDMTGIGVSTDLKWCERCGGNGFTGPGTGYDSVCSQCGGTKTERK